MDKDIKKQLKWFFLFIFVILSFCTYLIIPMFLDGATKAFYLATLVVISFFTWTSIIANFLLDWQRRRDNKKRI